ncbi:hypothetical protein THF1C08_1390003 [Vibrio jasicida]|nr:hypothetical protein THF1C08_1390003 [Vibrio jasicida]
MVSIFLALLENRFLLLFIDVLIIPHLPRTSVRGFFMLLKQGDGSGSYATLIIKECGDVDGKTQATILGMGDCWWARLVLFASC